MVFTLMSILPVLAFGALLSPNMGWLFLTTTASCAAHGMQRMLRRRGISCQMHAPVKRRRFVRLSMVFVRLIQVDFVKIRRRDRNPSGRQRPVVYHWKDQAHRGRGSKHE